MTFVVADRVKETSTSVGVGGFALNGALTGFQPFAAECAVGDTCYYAIQGVDAGGSPSGEWECGLGTYSALNTLTRTTVTSSSNAGVAVAFSAGDKHVFITMPAAQVAWARERLTAARTYYVATTGDDANDGLTVATPFATIQRAVNVVATTIDAGGRYVTIQLADGTYTAGVYTRALVGATSLGIQGNSVTPGNVVIATTSANAVNNNVPGFSLYVSNLKVATATSGAGVSVSHGAVTTLSGVWFGACASGHVSASGGVVSLLNNYTIAGAAPYHWRATNNGQVICNSVAITITGTPAFPSGFVLCTTRGLVDASGCTFSGSATGARYSVQTHGGVYTGTSGNTTYFPGNAAGSVQTTTYSMYY